MKIKRVLFAEAEDTRILKAARYLKDKGLAEPVLCAKPFKLREQAEKHNISTRGLTIYPPLHDPDFRGMVKRLQALYKKRNLNIDEAEKYLQNSLWYSALALKMGKADMVLAGNRSSVNDILKALINILDRAAGTDTISGYMLINLPESDNTLLFSDCTVIPQPNAEQLAQIAISSAKSFEQIIHKEVKVALLSFSTMGSAQHEKTEIVRSALQIVKSKAPHLKVEGEIQFDAAFVPQVAEKKIKNSILQGKANVFIFPNLNAANIGCKIAEHLAGCEVSGQFLQGLEKPFHILSPGHSSEDIIKLVQVAMRQIE